MVKLWTRKKWFVISIFLVALIGLCVYSNSKQNHSAIVVSEDLLDISTVEIVANENNCEFNVEDDSQWISNMLTKKCSYYKKYRGSMEELDHVYFKDSEGKLLKKVDLYRDTNQNQLGIVLNGNVYICDSGEVEFSLDNYVKNLQMQKMKSWINVGL